MEVCGFDVCPPSVEFMKVLKDQQRLTLFVQWPCWLCVIESVRNQRWYLIRHPCHASSCRAQKKSRRIRGEMKINEHHISFCTLDYWCLYTLRPYYRTVVVTVCRTGSPGSPSISGATGISCAGGAVTVNPWCSWSLVPCLTNPFILSTCSGSLAGWT